MKFLDFAIANKSVEGRIICPCIVCKFKKWESKEVVSEHLIIKPFPQGYTFWDRHGEKSTLETHVEPPSRAHIIEERI